MFGVFSLFCLDVLEYFFFAISNPDLSNNRLFFLGKG